MSHEQDINEFLERQNDTVIKNIKVVSRQEHGQKYMLHVTPTKVRSYIPMMPRSSAGSENAMVPRVTVSDTLMGCLIGYTRVDDNILNGQLYLGLDYKNGYYIYGLDWEYALKPNNKLVYDAKYSNEHWLVNYNKDTVEYKPTLLGKIIPVHYSITPRSDTVQDYILVTFVVEILEDTEFYITPKKKVSKGYWKIVADFSRYGLPGNLWGEVKNLSHDEEGYFKVEPISKDEYLQKKAGTAAKLSYEGYAEEMSLEDLSLESTQVLYPIYYRMYGNRRVQNLANPRIISLNSLPRNAAVHYLTNDEELDLDSSKPYFQGYTKRIVLEYPTELTSDLGSPRPKPLVIRNLTRDWLNKNRKFRHVPGLYKNTSDQLSLVVFNYNYLKAKYRYVPMPLTAYYQWKNQNQTVWDTIADLTKEIDRNHFVFMNAPEDIPGISVFRLYEERVNPTLIKVFDTPEKLFLLELWKFIHPEKRHLSFFKNIPTDKLNKVNIVFQLKDGRSTILNLGYLNSWIKDQPNSTDFKDVIQFKHEVIQKLLLKFGLILQSASPEQTVEDFNDDKEQEKEASLLDEMDKEESLEDPFEEDDIPPDTSSGLLPGRKGKDVKDIPSDTDKEVVPLSDKALDKLEELEDVSILKSISKIDEELNLLDKITKTSMVRKGIIVDANGEVLEDDVVDILSESMSVEDIKQTYLEAGKPIESLKNQIDELVDTGNLKASDYRTAVKDIDNYIGMQDPYGSKQSVMEASVVKPEDLEIREEDTKLVDNDTVFDKSMLETTLKSYTKKYVEKNLRKDILAMVGSLQRSGVVIRKHEVDVIENVLGAYEHHTLELKPINGTASRIHFRVPVVNPDGSFLSSGNKYTLRKQRVDFLDPLPYN